MASASRLFQPRVIAVSACLVAIAAGALLYLLCPEATGPYPRSLLATDRAADWPAPSEGANAAWQRLQAINATDRPAGALSRQFRLAGTFLEYGMDAPSRRKAVLDDTAAGVQAVVGEGETVAGVLVERVFIDHVILRRGAQQESLYMTFAPSAVAGGATTGSVDSAVAQVTDGAVADRFGGRRVGDNRWVFQRDALMGYYRELMDQPERLVQVFDSLAPLYGEDKKITGYQLRVEGEPQFFDAVGFREGDVVRRVNSMDMTNRRRAEFLIKQFVEGRSTAFVVDIERDGAPQKLIYQVR